MRDMNGGPASEWISVEEAAKRAEDVIESPDAARDARIVEIGAMLNRLEIAVAGRDARIAELGALLNRVEIAVAARDAHIGAIGSRLTLAINRLDDVIRRLRKLEAAR